MLSLISPAQLSFPPYILQIRRYTTSKTSLLPRIFPRHIPCSSSATDIRPTSSPPAWPSTSPPFVCSIQPYRSHNRLIRVNYPTQTSPTGQHASPFRSPSCLQTTRAITQLDFFIALLLLSDNNQAAISTHSCQLLQFHHDLCSFIWEACSAQEYA